jgi:PTH1 family peptidyl-tRNA hydrolase
MATKLIIGLGNPTVERKYNRHNIGFILVDAFTGHKNPAIVRCKGRNIPINYTISKGNTVLTLKPQDGMNDSGKSVEAVCLTLGIQPNDVLLIHDDLSFNFGTIKVKAKGSSGGHNGVKSIISALGTEAFARFKIGIGKPEDGDVYSYVLSDFTTKERTYFCELCALGVEVINSFVTQDIERTMSTFNR